MLNRTDSLPPRFPRAGSPILFIAWVLVLAVNGVLPQTPVKSSDAPIVQEFQRRVSKYTEERRKRAGTSPKPTASAEKLERAQQELAQKSQAMRSEADQGNIFSQKIGAYFRRQIAATLDGPEGTEIRASLRRAEPLADLPLRVNQTYPEKMALQSTPPSLLLNLPPLPKDLEYRIVGHNLVLLDVAPKLVVDFITDAIPPDKGRQ